MKKRILAVLLIGLFATVAYGDSRGTGLRVGEGVISNKSCRITSIELHTDGTNNAQVTLYDNAVASGGVIIARPTIVGSGLWGGRYWDPPRRVENGIYAVASSGTTYIIDYY